MNHTATAPRFCSRGRCSALNIVLMIVGFAVFWPLGLAMLAWMIWGDEIGRRISDLKGQFRSYADRAPSLRTAETFGFRGRETGNAAFDDYREREMKRLDEERQKLESMRADFEAFVKEVRRAKDQEEFDRFMAEFRSRTSGPAADA